MRDRVKATLRRAIELWQSGESKELLAHFPEMASEILPIHARLEGCATRALEDIVRNAAAPSRKDYALIVKDLPWAAVCFKLFGETAPSLEMTMSTLRALPLAALERMLERTEAEIGS